MRNENVTRMIFAAIAIAVNVVLGSVTAWMAIPLLFLDTLGTIFISATLGVRYGILTGICTNLVMGVTSGPTAIPFALVNVAVALVTGFIARKGFSLPKAVVTGLILSVVCPLIGTPIRLALFGGFTGSGTDIIILALKAAGESTFTATFWGAVSGNFVDKIISCVLVSFLMKSRGITALLPSRK